MSTLRWPHVLGCLVLAGAWGFTAYAQRPHPQLKAPALQTPSPELRTLNPGEKHTYPLQLKANDFLELVVTQQGIDVVVRLVGPDGKTLQEVDSPNGTQGPEPLSLIVEVGGNYLVEVESLEKTGQPGKYKLELEEIKTATEQDRAQLEIERLMDEAKKLLKVGKYHQGVIFAQQAVEQSEKIFGPEHLLLAESLNLQAVLSHNLGEYPRAEASYRRSLAITEKVLGPDHVLVATNLSNLAALHEIKLDYRQAEPLYQRALAIREKTLGPDHRSVATSLTNLAGISLHRGDYQQAELLYRRALAILEKVFGANHPSVAPTLNNLAELYLEKGDYQQAELVYQRALAIREQALGADHPEVAQSLNNLARFYFTKGDYQQAEPLFLRSLTIREKQLGPNHLEVARTLNNLGVFYRTRGDYQQAEPLLRRSLAIKEKVLGPESTDIATSLNNLGELHRLKSDYQQAELLLRRSVAIYEKAVDPAPLSVAASLNLLAVLYSTKGEYLQAESLYQRSLALLEKVLGPDHPDVAQSLNNLAWLHRKKGDTTQAIQCLTRSNDILERDLTRNLVVGSERQKSIYLRKTSLSLDQTLSLHFQGAPQSPDALQAAVTVVLRRKGRTLDAMTTTLKTLRQHQTPEIQKLLDDYASLVGQISMLTLRGPGKKPPEAHLADLQACKEKKDQLENEISRRSLEFQAQTTPITVEAVQQRIPLDAVLVEYVVYRPLDVKTGTFGAPHYVAYLLNRQGELRFVELGKAAPIEAAAEAFRQMVRDHVNFDRSLKVGAPAKSGPESVKTRGRILEQLIFEPVRKGLGSTTRVLLSPDGVLNLIPFDALVDTKGKYLVETYEFSYLTSGRDLLRLQTGIKSEQPPLVMANPDYAEGKGPRLLGQQFDPLEQLPGTAAEAQFLKTTFPGSTVYFGAEAMERVLTGARRPELVHIGTHGYFFPDVPPDSMSEFEANRLLQRDDLPLEGKKVRQENPLLRSYLFFAGANHSNDTPENDGILTALEASNLNLWGTKLVVLSACDTGLGDVRNGDGVYGLRRALVLAGSESQMVSLWPVSDEGTRDLMIRYYQLLKHGVGRSQALRQIRLEFLKNPKRRHPYFWASFILSGEWATLSGSRE